MDIELMSIEGDSSGFDAVVSFAQSPDELALFSDLADRSVTELLEAIQEESQGHLRNSAVRKYLEALPSGVHKQIYDLHENGETKKHVEIGDIVLTEVPLELPRLREMEGSVIGVGFAPGKTEVRIRSVSGAASASIDANDTQVDNALRLRRNVTRVLGVDDGTHMRLLRIEPAGAHRFDASPEAVEEHIFKRWEAVFSRLAE
ncbi:MAG: hypothetical protein ACRD2B_13125 [Terriglobia bacterium]